MDPYIRACRYLYLCLVNNRGFPEEEEWGHLRVIEPYLAEYNPKRPLGIRYLWNMLQQHYLTLPSYSLQTPLTKINTHGTSFAPDLTARNGIGSASCSTKN